MLGLIKKDLYYLGTSWKVLFLSVLIIGWFSTSKGFGAILIIVLPTFFGLSILGCIQQDAQKKWYDYYKILPILPNKIGASRYISFLSFIGIGLLISTVYGYGVQIFLGVESLGKNFTMLQGIEMGIAVALGFASFFIPVTYYNKGEKMEVSMIVSGFISFGLVYISTKILQLLGIHLMDYSHLFIQILFVVAVITFTISWMISNFIYNKKRY